MFIKSTKIHKQKSEKKSIFYLFVKNFVCTVRVRCVHSSFDSELKNKKSNYDDLFFFLLNIENKKIEKRCFIVSGHTKKRKWLVC